MSNSLEAVNKKQQQQKNGMHEVKGAKSKGGKTFRARYIHDASCTINMKISIKNTRKLWRSRLLENVSEIKRISRLNSKQPVNKSKKNLKVNSL